MRFSVAALIPLAALVAPALCGTVNARQAGIQARDWNDHKKDNDKDFEHKKHDDKECTWEPVFVNKNDWHGWRPGKHTPIDTKKCDKDTFEIDCKKFCVDHDKCNSCQVYSLEEAAEEFICELFEEIIDILTWEEDCDEDDKDGKKYYDSSCWNAHY